MTNTSIRKDREGLMILLQAAFPKMWMKYSEQFDGRNNAIWTGEGSEAEDAIPMFSIERDDETYQMGVHRSLVEKLDRYGWFAEFYDNGTVFIYPND